MHSWVTRISALWEDLVSVLIFHRFVRVTLIELIWSIIGVNLGWAVVLIVRFALWALHAGLDLSSNTNTVTDFAGCDLLSNTNDSADDFVSNTKRCYLGKLVEHYGLEAVGLRTLSSPQPPVMVWTSEPQTPQHSFTMSTSWSSKCLGVNYVIVNSASKKSFPITFSLLKSLHLSVDLIIKPSNCSGAAAILMDCVLLIYFRVVSSVLKLK